jgi:putative mRNA 3-end processing factor
LTFEISRLLIADFINLSGYYLPYEFLDLDTMIRSTVNIEYNNTFSVRNLKFKLLDAGHIPGSAQIDVELESNHHLVYTGDINLSDTKLLRGAFTGYSDLSCIIVEATYANEDHPNRKELERQFVLKIREVVERGGTVLVPAFSVGRSQEILSILAENNLEYPILVDGMALQVNEIMLQHPNYFRDYPLLRRSLEGVKWISRWRERKEAAKTPGVIVSPAGMLKGGPAAFYVEKVAKQKKNAILLVSFQIPGTPGRVLLYEKKVFIKGKAKRVEAEVERYDFSSHCGKSDLEAFLRNLKSNPTVFVVHGSEENCKSLAEYAKKEVGLESIVPSAGEVYKV